MFNTALPALNTWFLFDERLNNESDHPETGNLKLNIIKQNFFSGHQVQDVIVLPGSVYLEIAAAIYTRIFGTAPQSLKNISFGQFTIVSDEDIDFRIEITNVSEKQKRIRFYSGINSGDFFIASIEADGSISDLLRTDKFHQLESFYNSAESVPGSKYYSQLNYNGNQFSGYFQTIEKLWFADDKVVCKIDFSKLPGTRDLDAFKLDAFTQVLPVLKVSKALPYVLTSISSLEIFNPSFPEVLLCSGILKNSGENGFGGDVEVFGEDGTLYLRITGINYKYLENYKHKEQKSEGSINIAATYTAEPAGDSLLYWGGFFDLNYDIKFAPYNQVFQELLDRESLLGANREGYNVILINLEDWTKKEHKLNPLVSHGEIDNIFLEKERFLLPEGTEIVHLNRYETEYLYKEIFTDKCYLKNGITINDGDTVIDIGANIGLFTLFVNRYCKDPKVYSFEPSPVVYDLLRANSLVYGSHTKTFNCGVSDKQKTAEFTFYRSSSVFSGFNPDKTEDENAIKAVVKNMLVESGFKDDLTEYVDELTSGRLDKSLYECNLISVSDIISTNQIDWIDLLKIDAEKSELDILHGITAEDWIRIKQVVIEVHDNSGTVLPQIIEILTRYGFSIAVEEEKMLRDSGLFNVFARKNSEENNTREKIYIETKLSENISNLNDALGVFTKRSRVPLIISVTPVISVSDPDLITSYDKYENILLSMVHQYNGVYTLSSRSILNTYPVKNFADHTGNEMAHIPYTLPFFTAMGTALFRYIFSLRNVPKKVIALDCDNTLWKGICGEDGAGGIEISEGFRSLQKFLIEQIDSGVLVCLCSKNNEEDVMDVFRTRKDMLLKLDHLVTWRTNWNSKSSNLLSIAEELNLGLDSFVFIDDNPVECAEVKTKCPEVLTLQLPETEENIAAFLKSVWSLDHHKTTEEDKQRTKLYRENINREKHRSSSITLKAFLAGLGLNIKIFTPGENHINRISQLTFRTNQFNFTTRRRSTAEIIDFTSQENNAALIVEVSDRFGDYGIVGVVLYTHSGSTLKIDTFLLSCRVLGRGVEYGILSELGRIAESRNADTVELEYQESSKNRPALDFINKTASQFKSEESGRISVKYPADFAARIKYEDYLVETDSGLSDDKDAEKKNPGKTEKDISARIQTIADELNNAAEIFKRIEESKVKKETVPVSKTILPRNDFEKELAAIWNRVLGRTNVSTDENFLEAGGNSLRAVQLIAAIKKELKIDLSIVDLFECPTIQLLDEKINSRNIKKQTDTGVLRGSRRREIRISGSRGEKK